MHQSLILQVASHLALHGSNVRENIAVSDDHALGLRRRARREDNLQRVSASQRDLGRRGVLAAHDLRQILQVQRRNRMSRSCALVHMPSRPHQQLRLDPLKDPQRKVSRRSIVHRHHDHAAQCASEKHRDPFGAVLAPHHHPIALRNPPRLQLAGKAERHLQNLAIGERFHPVPAPLPVGAFMPVCPKVFREEFCDRFGHGWQTSDVRVWTLSHLKSRGTVRSPNGA